MSILLPLGSVVISSCGAGRLCQYRDHFQMPFSFQLHPLVAPQVSHLRQVPLRIKVKLLHSSQLSPS
jgi:hypothetical protein